MLLRLWLADTISRCCVFLKCCLCSFLMRRKKKSRGTARTTYCVCFVAAPQQERDLIAFDTMSASDLNHLGREAGTSPRIVRQLSPVKVPLNPRGLWRKDPGSQVVGLRSHSARVRWSNSVDSVEPDTFRNQSRYAPRPRLQRPDGVRALTSLLEKMRCRWREGGLETGVWVGF